MTRITRRRLFRLAAGAGVFAGSSGITRTGHATPTEVGEEIAQLAGKRVPQRALVTLTLPAIAEDGNIVPMSLSVESPMTPENHVASVTVFAEDNPNPEVASFLFSPMSGRAEVTTRIRLARSQTVIALARMNDGSVYFDEKHVSVTIGGCGA